MSPLPEPFAVELKVARSLLGGAAYSRIYAMLARGELDAIKDGKRTLITTESIRRRQQSLPKAKFRPPAPRRRA
jgi:hypothetical protein